MWSYRLYIVRFTSSISIIEVVSFKRNAYDKLQILYEEFIESVNNSLNILQRNLFLEWN